MRDRRDAAKLRGDGAASAAGLNAGPRQLQHVLRPRLLLFPELSLTGYELALGASVGVGPA